MPTEVNSCPIKQGQIIAWPIMEGQVITWSTKWYKVIVRSIELYQVIAYEQCRQVIFWHTIIPLIPCGIITRSVELKLSSNSNYLVASIVGVTETFIAECRKWVRQLRQQAKETIILKSIKLLKFSTRILNQFTCFTSFSCSYICNCKVFHNSRVITAIW